MRGLFLFILVVLGFVACKKDASPEEVALQVAKTYYDQLLEGDAESFVDGMDLHGDIYPSYREQLIANARMFVHQQETEHNGIKEVRPMRATVDTIMRADTIYRLEANTFLLLCFGDSLEEEVVVPLVRRNGIWLMR